MGNFSQKTFKCCFNLFGSLNQEALAGSIWYLLHCPGQHSTASSFIQSIASSSQLFHPVNCCFSLDIRKKHQETTETKLLSGFWPIPSGPLLLAPGFWPQLLSHGSWPMASDLFSQLSSCSKTNDQPMLLLRLCLVPVIKNSLRIPCSVMRWRIS